MKFIKANWKGFEVDSSEFSVSLEIGNVERTIKAFWSSSFIEPSGDSKYVRNLDRLFKVLEIAKLDKPNFLDTMIDDERLGDFIERVRAEDEDSYFITLKKIDIFKLAKVFDNIKYR